MLPAETASAMALHFITFIVIAPLVLKLSLPSQCRSDG
ncbi:putative membrane protein [Pseudomonas aeruginosa]|nr:putative membrane protein [Pseudomonas aeruginosa]